MRGRGIRYLESCERSKEGGGILMRGPSGFVIAAPQSPAIRGHADSGGSTAPFFLRVPLGSCAIFFRFSARTALDAWLSCRLWTLSPRGEQKEGLRIPSGGRSVSQSVSQSANQSVSQAVSQAGQTRRMSAVPDALRPGWELKIDRARIYGFTSMMTISNAWPASLASCAR